MGKKGYKYYKIVGTIDGQEETFYGSYVMADCEYQLDDDREYFKDQGYTGIHIKVEYTQEEPDNEVYSPEELTRMIRYY